MKILFIEDDESTSEVISATLTAHRYAVDVAADGPTGLAMAIQWTYDLILLDVVLPELNGFQVCRQLRAQDCQTPILILTTQGSSDDVITGLDAGADDYVTKSCDADQLLARVRALLRRSSSATPSPLLYWGGLCLDPAAAQVTYQQQLVPCRPKEYTLLELFLRNPQRLLSRSAIIDHLWSFDDAPVEGSVTTLIKDLRRRLKAAGMEVDPIETVYGLGYRLKREPHLQGGTASALPSGYAAPISGQGQQRLNAAIYEASKKFQASLSSRLEALQAVEASVQRGEIDQAQLQLAQTVAHKLAGGLGTFGYAKASDIAEALEASLKAQINQETAWANQFSQLVTALQQELAPLVEAPPSVANR